MCEKVSKTYLRYLYVFVQNTYMQKTLMSLSKKILSTHEAFQIDQWQKNQAEENLVLQSLLKRKEKIKKLFDKDKNMLNNHKSFFERAKKGGLFSS